jgi:serine/threonine protein kinase
LLKGLCPGFAYVLQGRNKITKHVEREVICHSNFCHPHIIQFKEIFLTPTHLAIAMEYAPGGDMFQYVKKSSGLKVCTHMLLVLLVAYLELCSEDIFAVFQVSCNAESKQILIWLQSLK